MPLKIIIVGGGIGGLAAAGYLRAQHDVMVLERGRFDFTVDDYGMSVLSNAFNLLQKAGIKYENLDSVVMTHLWMRNHQNDEIRTIDFDTRARFSGAPSVLVRRAKLQSELLRFATSPEFPGKPAEIIQRAWVTDVNTSVGEVTLEDGRVFRGDLVVGADGINSTVRPAVLDGSNTPTTARTHDLLLFMAGIPLEAIQAEPDFNYLANPTQQAGLVVCSAPEGLEAKRRMLIYNVSSREFQILGYATEKEYTENFDSAKTSIIKDVPISQVVEEFGSDFKDSLVNLFRHSKIDAWRVRDLPPINRWFRDKAVLIGDAVHAVTPHAGQGCNITIEDAEALGYLLKRVESPDDLASALGKFVLLRKDRAHYVARRSREQGNIQTADDKTKEPIKQEDFTELIYAYQGAEESLKNLQGL